MLLSVSAAQTRWLRLEELLRRPRRGRRRLTPDEAAELARLYRQVASDLAAARRAGPDSSAAQYLNDLAMRAHSRLYAPRRTNLLAGWQFLKEQYPALIAQYRRGILLATLLFFGGTVIGFAAVTWDPNLAEALVPAQFREAVARPLDGELATFGSSPILSTQILTNNIKVGILAFGLGLTFGVGTTYVLLYNGVMLGGLAAVYHKADLAIPFWATILPHGVIELTAIFISGAAGFVLAGALIRPGVLTRRRSLARAAPAALGLVLGTIPMYVVAGFIEGFITPRDISHGAKLWFSLATGIVMIPYLWRWRRATTPPAPSPPGTY